MVANYLSAYGQAYALPSFLGGKERGEDIVHHKPKSQRIDGLRAEVSHGV